MKTTLVMFVMLAIWPFSSSREYHMTSNSGVPAATGTVKVRKDKDNGNMKLDIKVEHLANPSSLTPPATSYIVWVRPKGQDAIKQGAIRVDKNLSAELKTATTSKTFDVVITAEQSDNVTFPSATEVLSAHVSPD